MDKTFSTYSVLCIALSIAYLLNKNGQNFLDIQYMFAWSIAVKKNWSRPQQIFDNYQPDSIMVLMSDGTSEC